MRKLKVLYSVLDWGLGHATRSIPLIRALIDAGHTLIIAGEGRSLLLLRQEFPECQFANLQGFQVKYPEKRMTIWLLRNLPSMFIALKQERKQTRELVIIHKPDLIISDHRYGCYDPAIPSYFIAHQLRIRAGIFTGLVLKLQSRLINKFDSVWIPDYENAPGLSGELAHHPSVKRNFKFDFIGPLSRLKNVLSLMPVRKYQVLILLSGPEPQRTRLEEICIAQLKNSNLPILLIQGKPESDKTAVEGNITIQPGITPAQLRGLMETTPVIICRPGYSTIMDLEETGRNAILIPTPSQTEQEYLAKLQVVRGCIQLDQTAPDLPTAIAKFQPKFNIPSKGNALNHSNMLEQILLNH